MANRNWNRRQALEKEVKDIYAQMAVVSSGAPPPSTLDTFAILGASTVTNTGFSVITGDLGLSPGTSVTGFPPGTVSGTQHITDATAAAAQVALTSLYTDMQSRAVTTNYSGTDLGTLTLGPGVYKFNTSAQLTGTLTLDAGGNANAVWVFQIGSTLTTASASSVSIINGGQAANAYFAVGSSATLGTTTAFKGNILCQASATLNTGASVLGRVLVRTGAVTLDTNIVTVQTSSSTTTISNASVAGIQSITRNGIGDYSLVLQDAYWALKNFKAAVISALPQDIRIQLYSAAVNNASSREVRFLMLAGAVPVDPNASGNVLIKLELKNSSSPF